MKTPRKLSRFARSSVWLTVLVGAAIATGCQHAPEPEIVGYLSPCYTGNGGNALTIALPSDSNDHLEAIYIRRKGCEQWSQNLGVVLAGKSIHILNLDDGEMEVFWRERPHTFGVRPAVVETPPTPKEWLIATESESNGDTVTLNDETHRRIVVL